MFQAAPKLEEPSSRKPSISKATRTLSRKWTGTSLFTNNLAAKKEASYIITRDEGGFFGEAMLTFAAAKDMPK